MKKLLLILPLVFLLCLTFSCQQTEEVAEEPAVDIEAETEALKQAFGELAKAAKTKDLELMVSTWADDLISFNGDKEATRAFFATRLEQGISTEYTLDKIEISASGDLGYTAFSFEGFRVEEGETISTGKGFNVTVWKKQADGTWKQVAF
jgi:ketosteroid isomerase-like protein